MSNAPQNKNWTCTAGCGTKRTGHGHGRFSNEGSHGWFWICSDKCARAIVRTARLHRADLT